MLTLPVLVCIVFGCPTWIFERRAPSVLIVPIHDLELGNIISPLLAYFRSLRLSSLETSVIDQIVLLNLLKVIRLTFAFYVWVPFVRRRASSNSWSKYYCPRLFNYVFTFSTQNEKDAGRAGSLTCWRNFPSWTWHWEKLQAGTFDPVTSETHRPLVLENGSYCCGSSEKRRKWSSYVLLLE